MMRKIGVVAFVLLLGTCGAQMVRSATAGPLTVPIQKDVLTAERDATSRVGGVDEKLPLPEAGPDTIGGNGLVEPAQRETKVAAQVTAVVKQVAVTEGQTVKAGDLLVQLENGVELAQLAAAEADLAAERAAYTRTLKGLRVEDRDAVSAETQAARARAELSQSVLARTEQLAKTGAATPDELERARRAAQQDAANARASDARLRAAESGSRGEDIALQRARVLGAEARVAQAKAQLERLAVRSPIEGEVLQVKVRQGELYNFAGTEPLVVMGDTRTLRVRMDVDERDIARVRTGASAYVTADAFGATRFSGTVVEVGRRFGRKNVRTDDPTEKNDTKILEVVIQLDAKGQLVPGQRVSSFIAVGPTKT
ncbi:MAG: HlyD family efflux transporter periplasmic adaptor subunit [Myxococcaceae bacterium]|jgi:HlyD family secretion protein|nr:HlyD family efflux transporter periplasmic adaptor subunit [Myxococcaceae bacterium]